MQQQLDHIIINLTSECVDYAYKLILKPPQWLASHYAKSNWLGPKNCDAHAHVTTCDRPVTL